MHKDHLDQSLNYYLRQYGYISPEGQHFECSSLSFDKDGQVTLVGEVVQDV